MRLTPIILTAIMLNGCAGAPKWPEKLDATEYAHLTGRAYPNATGLIVELAGVRSTKRGLYVDLLMSDANGVDESRARDLGFGLSTEEDPNRFLEIRATDGTATRLFPMRYGRSLFGHSCRLRSPPTLRLNEQRVIQTCMFRTSATTSEGACEVRFTSVWTAGGCPADLAKPLDTDWHRIEIRQD